MKKLVLWGGIGLLVLIIIGVLAVSFFLDGAIKRGVETVGPQVTGVDVKLNAANLSVLSGSGTLKGLVIGNPKDFKTAQAISIGSATLALKPGSLLSDKIVINKIEIVAPDITFEIGLRGNNLGKILDNLGGTGGDTNAPAKPKEQPAAGSEKKLQVDEFVISQARLRIAFTDMKGQDKEATIPEIRLTALGTGPDGITARELSNRVLKEIYREAAKLAGDKIPDLTKQVLKNSGLSTNTIDAIGKGVGDLLKKK